MVKNINRIRGKLVKDCAEKLWDIFEKTGAISAYILYDDMQKKAEKCSEESEEVYAK